jgi:hypothetical protein
MLYDKRTPTALTTTSPTGTAVASEELDIANESLVALHVLYQANGASKTLRVYPEVRLPVGDLPWVPALSATLDVSGATVDGEGYLPLPGASPILEIAGISGVEVRTTLHLPVPTGDRFRVRVLEDGYSGAALADLTVLAAAVRGTP